MIIKLNLLEMTFEQRRNTAQLLLTYPPAVPLIGIDDRLVKEDVFVIPTEEQRLDAEQKRDISEIKEIRESGHNLNAIFGEPGKVVMLTDDLVPSVPLDKEGFPWDNRIHASTKTFIADGSWKLRRGVDPAEVEKVKAQLKELMAVPTVRNVPNEVALQVLSDGKLDIPAPVLTPTSVGYVPVPPAIVGVDLAAGNDTAVITPVPPAPKSHYLIDQQPVDTPISVPKSHYLIDQQPATVTLTELISRMSSAIVAGKMTQATVSEMCIKHGVSEFMLLSSRLDLLPLIDADMKAMGV